MPDDAVKCEFCGEILVDEPTQKIDINEMSDNEAPEEEQRSTHDIFEENARKRKEQVEKAKNEKQQQLDEITERRNAKQQRRKRNKIILISVICIAVIAAAGAGTYMFKAGMFNTDKNATVIATPNPNAPATPIPTIAPVTTPLPSQSAQPENQTQDQNNAENTSENGANWTATNGSSSNGGASNSSGSSSGNSSGKSSSSSGTGSGSGTSSSNSNSGASSSSGSGSSSNSSNASGASSNGGSAPASGSKITSVLATGGKVIKDSSSGKSFMTFLINGKTYYANVSPDSTTEQISDKPMTITASPTTAKYNGNTVYEISSLTYYDGRDYIIPDSGTKLIKKADIQNLSKDKLALARNEIYARHGRKFQMTEFQTYFDSKSWYKVNPNYDYTDDNNNLNDIEKTNVDTILSVENSK